MLPFRNGRPGSCGRIVRLLSIFLLLFSLALEPAVAAKPKGGKKNKKTLSPTPTAAGGPQSLTNIPLPIGHEAKGLILPDFDAEGHLRGKFEAAAAKRLDEYHIGFKALKITTYTPENKSDMTIELSEAVLNLNTRILSSKERTFIKRADFNVAGDTVEFDTNARISRLVGNVKMVITTQSQLLANPNE